MQQTTYMIGMIGHPKRLCNDLRDTPTGPQRRIKASRLRALKQKLLQLILVLGAQLTAPPRMRFGFEPRLAGLRFHRLPTRHRGGGDFDQTSYFVDAFAFLKQLSRPLTTIFQGPSTIQPKSTNKATDTVFATRTGSKYHRSGCRFLSKSQIPYSLEEAKTRYSPCKVCKPPE